MWFNRELHAGRQDVIKQWEEAIELVHKRDVQIHKLTEEFSQNQQNLRKQKRSLDDFDKRLYNEQEKYVRFYYSTLIKIIFVFVFTSFQLPT
jgi:chromosome condensin MukBEF ATPase and DNA-binding subunit MukB